MPGIIVKPIPKRLLMHSIQYQAPKPDEFTPAPAPVTINNVLVQHGVRLKRDTTSEVASYQSVVFIDALNSKPVEAFSFSDFEKGATVTFDGDDMTVKEVNPAYDPLSQRLHHVELSLE